MSYSSTRRKQPSGKARYIGIRLVVASSEAFKSLSPVYRALYLDLRRQFNGYNNGRIAATDTLLSPFGWSHSTIHKGLALLIEHKLLERIRVGGLGERGKKCSLYAFLDEAVHDDEARGVRGRLPTFAYREYKPPVGLRNGGKKSKVHAMTNTVHAVDLNAHSRSTM